MISIDMTIVNEETLRHLNACEDGIAWFLEEYGELPANEVEFIEIDNKEEEAYAYWLIDEFIKSTYDERGNVITYKHSNEYSCEYTYDERDNQLTCKDSRGYSCEYTYDERDNQLTRKDSRGYSWVKTYDDRDNQLTCKDSDGYSVVYKYDADGTQLTYRGGY